MVVIDVATKAELYSIFIGIWQKSNHTVMPLLSRSLIGGIPL